MGEPAHSGDTDVARAAKVLNELSELDPDIVSAIERVLGRGVDRENLILFVQALTAERTGRSVASEVLGIRIADRLMDAREVTRSYQDLLDDPASNETSLQSFIEQHHWLLGLEYVRIRPRRAIPRGIADFILERYDGFHDLLELKSPHDDIIAAPDSSDGVPPVASSFSLSPDLSNALAQAHVYRDTLSSSPETLERLYGLSHATQPRVLIIIGQGRDLPVHRARVLHELNLSLHRIEIVPYDALALRAGAILDNLESHLEKASTPTA
jgi:hypothetical protein